MKQYTLKKEEHKQYVDSFRKILSKTNKSDVMLILQSKFGLLED